MLEFCYFANILLLLEVWVFPNSPTFHKVTHASAQCTQYCPYVFRLTQPVLDSLHGLSSRHNSTASACADTHQRKHLPCVCCLHAC